MSWYESVVLVRAEDRIGSGVLLDASTVLTAAHVVAPAGVGAASNADIVVELPWVSYRQSAAQATRVHPSWGPGAFDADLATIRIEAAAGLGLSTGELDETVPAYLYGFPANAADPMQPQHSYQSGLLKAVGAELFSDVFHVLSGMSGSPFVQTMDGVTRVVGLATWDANTPGPGGFKGLSLAGASLSAVWPMPQDN